MTVDGWFSGTSDCPNTDQIHHFVGDGVNLIRVPVSWQALVCNDQTSTSLNTTYFTEVDKVVQAALAQGSYVMLVVDNHARWDGKIIGEDGPAPIYLASLWGLLAYKYVYDQNVLFGLMSQPYDVDIQTWAEVLQSCVNSIREVGATMQSIVLTGNDWGSVSEWSSGRNDPLLNIADLYTTDTSLLILDAVTFLNQDHSGNSPECVTNNVDILKTFHKWLKRNDRKALISQTGAGSSSVCIAKLYQQLEYIADNDDVLVGFAILAAGNVNSSYPLNIAPENGQDRPLFTNAIKPLLPGHVVHNLVMLC
ncbi:carboxymethylcellulase [Naematelia encephala]|uniref:cellulase n=1 Tax=Naematelia encephala TaxID=71784 RepID=A0A1Y2AWN5_9TREE|nr:carboxymethylcellulase [Naematelia encephala]